MKKSIDRIFAASALILLVLTGGVVAAQEATEAPESVIIGDSESETLAVVRQFLDEENTDVLAEDLTYVDRTLPEPIVGRDAYLQSGIGFYGEAFTQFFYEPRRYIVAEPLVVVEFEFLGTPSPQDAGAEAGGPEATVADAVSVPMVGIFEVHEGAIIRIDMFYDAAALQYQLGYDPYYDPYYDTAYPAPGMTGPVGAEAALTTGEHTEVDAIVLEPETYIGTTRIVRGNVGPALSDKTFVLLDDDLLDVAQEQLLVIDVTETGLNFIQLANTGVLVSGTIQAFAQADFEAEYGLTLDESTFSQYEGLPVLLADRAVNLFDVATLDAIRDEPAAFFGQTVTVRGNVTEHVGANGFVINEAGLIDLNPNNILVLAPDPNESGGLPPVGEPRAVTGIVRQFIRADLETELGITLDEAAFGAYESLPVIVADAISDAP